MTSDEGYDQCVKCENQLTHGFVKKKQNKKYTCTYLTDICTCNGVFFRGQQSIIAYGCQNFVVVFDPKSVQVRCHIKELRSINQLINVSFHSSHKHECTM